jgi:hypothetical protein
MQIHFVGPVRCSRLALMGGLVVNFGEIGIGFEELSTFEGCFAVSGGQDAFESAVA